MRKQGDVDRESLVKGSGVPPHGCLGEDGAGAELEKILDAVGNSAASVRTDPGELAGDIEACVKKMRDTGRNPSVTLVSDDHRG